MAGYDNIKDKGFDHRSTEELREIQSRGGRASGASRRRRAAFRENLNFILTTGVNNPEGTPVLQALGIESTLESAIHMAMIKEALAGNVKAYEAIAKYSGQGTGTDADLEEQRIRTDRAKRARDQEVGDTDGQDENIQAFLRAMNPTQGDVDSLYGEEQEEEGSDAEEKESAGEI